MGYIIFCFVILIWLIGLLSLRIVKLNITPEPEMTPERLYSEAEIAAKSIGYWEKRSLESLDEKEEMRCVTGLINAQSKYLT